MKTLSLLTLVSLAFLLTACPRAENAPPTPPNLPKTGTTATITVFAAASMTDVVNDLKAALEKEGKLLVKTSYGATSDLARQVTDGAPCDVFISASADWMVKLKDKKTVEDNVVMATNKLVCVVKGDSALKADAPAGLKHPAFVKFAVCDENVPAGKYARQALKGVLEHIKGRFVGQKDVRAALKAVAAGECEAGFVYSTDALAEKGVKVLFTFDEKTHDRIVYPAGVVSGSKNKDAAKVFLDYVRGAGGREILAARGFGPGDVN